MTVPATNFTALRVRRDILANSDIGAVLLNKEDGRSGIQPGRRRRCQLPLRTVGLVQRVRCEDVFARRSRAAAGARLHDAGRRRATKAASGRSNGRFDTIGARFNDEMGFVPRHGVDNAFIFVGRRFRPVLLSTLGARDAAALAGRHLHPPGRRRTGVALPGLPPALRVPGRVEHGDGRQPERRGRPRPVHHQQLARRPRARPDATNSTSTSSSGTRTAPPASRSTTATRSAASTTATAAATRLGRRCA